MTPFIVNKKVPVGQEQVTQPVRCGRCPACYAYRVSQWSFRLMQQEKVSSSAYFITLTYDTKYVPITLSGFMSISKRDVQLFFKSLRKLNDTTLKYFAVGEYGGKTYRPHYHIILFNAKLNTIQLAWTNGSVHYGDVSGASIGYTLKYMSKQSKIPVDKNDDRVKEFGLMSKGLGANYLTDAMRAWHHADKNNRMYCNLTDGKKISMPRYYKSKIYTDEERKIVGWHTRKKQIEEQNKRREGDDGTFEERKAEAVRAAFSRMQVKANDISNNKI